MIFRYENPMAFQLLWLLPVLVAVSWWLYRMQWARIQKALGSRLAPVLTASVSKNRRRWKLALEVLAVVFFVIAFARPQYGESQQKVKSEGVELMFLVDVSRSMLAEDVRPSRLELVKKEIKNFIDAGGGDRLGLIAFAGSSILLSPMTPDKSAIKMYLDSLSVDSVSTQGTEFKKALHEAHEAFKGGGVEETEKSVITKAVVIVSDGEDNEPGALAAAEKLLEDGVRIFTIGVGTSSGGKIPNRDRRGNLRGFRKSRQGKEILSKTNTDMLKKLSQEGKGSFHQLTFGGETMRQLRKDLEKLEKSEFASAEVTNYDERYQLWLLLGLVLAMIELALGEKKKTGRLWRGRFEVTKS